MRTIFYITNIAPHYRSNLWSLLVKEKSFKIYYLFGKSSKGIKEIDFGSDTWIQHADRVKRLVNRRFRGVVVWQSGVLKLVWSGKYDELLLLSDVFIISNWFAVALAKIRRKRVYLWGHGIYGNERGIKLLARKVFFRMANHILVYNHRAKGLLSGIGIDKKKISVIYNSLDYDKMKGLRNKIVDEGFYRKRNFFKNNDLPVLVFIGRLTGNKRLDLLIDAVKKLNQTAPTANLIVIGKGEVLSQLKEQSKSIKEYVHFYGDCYDELTIGEILGNADLCVSPGNVGLTAIHSLSFGTPVCTHDDFVNQMPEYESITEGKTGTFFSFQEANLYPVIKKWLDNEFDREDIRKNCYQVIDDDYNPYNQVKAFRSLS